MVVVGGGPTGIELSGEIHDFLEEDLQSWYPELSSHVKISLVEALPSVLPMFSKKLIDYTESTFKEAKIDILTKTMVKEIKEKSVVLQLPDGQKKEVPCGMVVWAAVCPSLLCSSSTKTDVLLQQGNTLRKLTRDLMGHFPAVQTNRRGIVVDEHMRMVGVPSSNIFALGDCTATSYAPTAQVASQQGSYLARVLRQIAKQDKIKEDIQALASQDLAPAELTAQKQNLAKQLEKVSKLKPFEYSHQGSLAYIGSDKAIADLPFGTGNVSTFTSLLDTFADSVCSWLPAVLRRSCSGAVHTSATSSLSVTVRSSPATG